MPFNFKAVRKAQNTARAEEKREERKHQRVIDESNAKERRQARLRDRQKRLDDAKRSVDIQIHQVELFYRSDTITMYEPGHRVTLPGWLREEYFKEVNRNSRPRGFVMHTGDVLRFRGAPTLTVNDWFVDQCRAGLSTPEYRRYLEEFKTDEAKWKMVPVFCKDGHSKKSSLDYTTANFIVAKNIIDQICQRRSDDYAQRVSCIYGVGNDFCSKVEEEDGDIRVSKSFCNEYACLHWRLEQMDKRYAKDMRMRGYIATGKTPRFVLSEKPSQTLLALNDRIRSTYHAWACECLHN